MLGLLEKIIIHQAVRRRQTNIFSKKAESTIIFFFSFLQYQLPLHIINIDEQWYLKYCMVVTILKNLSTSGHRRLWLILTIQSCIYAIYDDTYFYCAMIMMMSILISKVKTLWVWRYLYMYMYVPIVYYQASN